MSALAFWRLGALREEVDGGQGRERVGTWHFEEAELSQS
jgi:hypothetical protein